MRNQYVEFIEHMQLNGMKYNPPSIQKGVMINTKTLRVGDLQITSKNIYVASDLVLKAGDQVATIAAVNGQTYFILCKVVNL